MFKDSKLFMGTKERIKEIAIYLRFDKIINRWSNDIKVYIISYPKSGRTWLRILFGKALSEQFHLDETLLLETHPLTRSAKINPTLFTHDGAGFGDKNSWNELATDKSFYRNKKVVFLVRDPKDVIVSSYFHVTKRQRRFDGSISEFIRSDIYGIKKIVTFYKIWLDNQTVPKDFLLLKYENMHKDTSEVLRSLLSFTGVQNVPGNTIETAVNFSDFENMRKLESSQKFSKTSMQPGDTNDEESYKVRKGKVGSYLEYLSQDDMNFINQVIEEAGHPFGY
ncbi:MAG: sulfotransferase domain-containing protein [Coleofasciculus sp. G3-WIS-01]|uniref:sulfotransferase domain-containing protein n=1 Tax=Coleofasciculus sp. G3-WIS-01 TaxID=3069528 RepID=UPI0032FCCA68